MSTILMVTAMTPSDLDSAHCCLALRFCGVDDVARMERLMITQIRARYHRYHAMKPKQVRAEVEFHVYEVPQGEPPRNGWPAYLGEAGWYK